LECPETQIAKSVFPGAAQLAFAIFCEGVLMKISRRFWSLNGILALILIFSGALQAQVRAWQGSLEIPTYGLGPADPNPAFPLVNRHLIYPYTMLDDLTDHRAPKTYRAIYLENRYLKLTVLPDLGGRLYSVYDKVDGREIFYRNHVVKYGLIGVRGAWISGGVEFNFPNAHTVVTVSPVESVILRNPDGSATAVVGAMDWVSNMHWEVALTLRPDQARVGQRVTLFNSTPLEHLYWFWANAAVRATDDLQFIYPMREVIPDDPYAAIESWPVWQGVDRSWYKNLKHATAIFGRQVHRNFFGVYYHNSDYGVVHVSNFRKDPGKKIWSWGTAGDGLIWARLLSDHDGPYNEIQSGRFATQLYREFMNPRRVEDWTEYWYPVRGLSGRFVEATKQLALNILFPNAQNETAPADVKLIVSPVVELHNARVRVFLGAKFLREFVPATFEPLQPAAFTLPVESVDKAKKELRVQILSTDGKELLSWSAAEPIDGNPDFVPAAGIAPGRFSYSSKTPVEEIYLHGVWLEKRGNPEAAQEFYQRALERDPDFIPALLKEAWKSYQAADFSRAEALIARALERDNSDPRVHYAAGTIYRAAGRLTLAQDAFWASIHWGGSPAPALTELGEIALRQGNAMQAAQLLRRALNYNPDDAFTRADLGAALRLAGGPREAERTSEQAVRQMPLLPYALAEQWLDRRALGVAASASQSASAQWIQTIGFDPQNYLAVAAWYHGLGDFRASDAALHAATENLPAAKLTPMIYYYLASNARAEGRKREAQQDAQKAASLPCEEVFPNRLEDAKALAEAIAFNPADAHAQYALGNFFFAHGRYDDAARLWFKALGEGFEDPVLMRNLGVYAWRVKKDLPSAAGFFRQAIHLRADDFRLYADLDAIDAQMGNNSARAQLFRSAPPAVLQHDVVRLRHALFLTEQGKFEDALSILTSHDFKPWEGGQEAHEIFVLAHLEEGKKALAERRPQAAEQAFRQALKYPENLGVGKPYKPDDEEPLYWLGVALQAEGKRSQAEDAWKQAASEGKDQTSAAAVFSALALEKLGQNEEAQKILARCRQSASRPDAGPYNDFISGLAERYGDLPEEAKAHFHHALELNPQFWQARVALNEMKSSAGSDH
jgi:tetratricopeptide (TPR) repeat protein